VHGTGSSAAVITLQLACVVGLMRRADRGEAPCMEREALQQ